MTLWETTFLLVGGFVAGIINTMAGGGSALSVPLLVLAGVPGTLANGSNRVGMLTSNVAATLSFRGSGVDGWQGAAPILVPAVCGALLGSLGISQLADDTFETVFGFLMIPIIILTIFKPKPAKARLSGCLPSSWRLVSSLGGGVAPNLRSRVARESFACS